MINKERQFLDAPRAISARNCIWQYAGFFVFDLGYHMIFQSCIIQFIK